MALRRVFTTWVMQGTVEMTNWLPRSVSRLRHLTTYNLRTTVVSQASFASAPARFLGLVVSGSVFTHLVDGLLRPLLVSRTSAGTAGDLNKPLAVTAGKIVQVSYDLVSTQTATSTTNGTGNNAWQAVVNALGAPNGTVATHTGQTLSATAAPLTLTYPVLSNKTALVISKVEVKFYVAQTGTAFNNGGLVLSFKGVTLATLTGNVDALTVPLVFDVTAQIAGSWANLASYPAKIDHNVAAGTNFVTASVDAVEVVVTASLVQNQAYSEQSVPGLRSWWDASQDPAPAGVAANIPDHSGNGYTLTNATPANRPTIVNSPSRHYLFDSSDSMAFTGYARAIGYTIFLVYADPGSIGSDQRLITDTSSGLWEASGNRGPYIFAGGSFIQGNYVGKGLCVLTAVLKGNGSYLKRNNVQIASGNSGSNGLTNVTLGAGSFSGRVHQVTIYNGEVSAADQTEMVAYLRAKWGF